MNTVEQRNEHIDRLFHIAESATGLDLDQLGYDDELPELDRKRSLRQAKLLAGCLWSSSVVVVDELFMDIKTLADLDTVTPKDIEGTFVLSGLPKRFSRNYSALFAQRLLVVMSDLTSNLTRGWSTPSCVAQDLALRLWLNAAEASTDLWNLDLADGWRGRLEETLFEDTDHEMLFDPSMDGFENDDAMNLQLGMAPMKFEDWFTPFNNRHVPPYAMD